MPPPYASYTPAVQTRRTIPLVNCRNQAISPTKRLALETEAISRQFTGYTCFQCTSCASCSLCCGCQWGHTALDRKSTRLNSSHLGISYAVFCLYKITFELSADWIGGAAPVRSQRETSGASMA